MKKAVSLILVLVIGLGLVGSAMAWEWMYVKTGNGRGLNVRDMYTGEVIGSLKYGEQVGVDHIDGPWAFIYYGSQIEAKVAKKFLVHNKPGKYVPTNTDGTGTGSTDALSATTLDGMNRQYSSLKFVDPYTVVTVPATRTGTVNLRWGPSKNTNLLMKAAADYELTVLAESKSWLLVQDPDTGKVGYIAKKFTNAR